MTTPAHHDDNGASLQPVDHKRVDRGWIVFGLPISLALWAAIIILAIVL